MSGGDVTIIGGGWSVLNLALDRLCGRVIAVNDAAVLAPRWDIAVSMDRLWTENRFRRVMARSVETDPRREIWLRRSAVQNLGNLEGWPWIHVFECDHRSPTFSTDPKRLNGTNSGGCALNLAWHLKPARLFLLGFDMNRDAYGRAYWYPPYPWSSAAGGTSDGKYAAWSKQFTAAASAFARIGCAVFNVSPASAIKVWPKMTPAQYLKECNR